MDINYLREFCTLAETGNFLEAAERLFISQSTLSRHLQAMEAELGAPLFTRTTRRVEINEYGRLFLPYARQIMDIQDEYTREMAGKLKNLAGLLSVGSIPVMAQYDITTLFAGFQKDYPEYTLKITEAESTELKAMVRGGECDFAFVRGMGQDEQDFSVLPYTEDNLAAILPADHPLAKAETIQMEQLRDDKFLLLPEGSLVHTLCIKACSAAGFVPRICYTGHRAANIIDLVTEGMGVAVLTKRPARYYASAAISIVDIVPRVTTKIDIISLRGQALSPVKRQFMEYLRNHVRGQAGVPKPE